ncbi:bifunctional tetrahydrofolate synthase/dihydrofolate synthase [Neptunicella sp. SCSIO 80796]|uniref:bifunctional tetrahydrofolate synthase/dihydrofolate synthase n=1 Tax=Neptunicella plasticusilytica TaxID=3117012 RepID=UPI003A4DF461
MDSNLSATLTTLSQWLEYLEKIHPQNIELGLERVRQVFQRMQLDFDHSKVIMVAGTNGKGTTCAMVEQACLLAGKTVGVYSSPHLIDYRERIKVNGAMLDEQQHVDAFTLIEDLRADISLTYFEFGTLAGLYLLAQQQPDVVLLEIGLGGRLDAVNIVEPDLSVITTIDLDHQDYLGDTREKIGFEKAGILRHQGEAIIGETDPPQSLLQQIKTLQVNARFQGKDYLFEQDAEGLCWQGEQKISSLPPANIPLANAANAFAVIEWLDLALSHQQFVQLMSSVKVSGRCQILQNNPTVMLDVAHNPQSTGYLANKIDTMDYRQLHLVVAMLKDKDIANSLIPLQRFSANWYTAGLAGPRGGTAEGLNQLLMPSQTVLSYLTVKDAYRKAVENAHKDDLVVVFGSFHTVAEVLQLDPDEGN